MVGYTRKTAGAGRVRGAARKKKQQRQQQEKQQQQQQQQQQQERSGQYEDDGQEQQQQQQRQYYSTSASTCSTPGNYEEEEVQASSSSYTIEEQVQAGWSAELCSVLKVSTVHSNPNFATPWKTSAQWSSVGTAFPLEGRKLLTNAHVVANAQLIHVRRCDGHKKYVAKVRAICFECDLALLEVEDDCCWQDLTTLRLAVALPRLQDEVAVVGFPDAPSGGESICITQGVVSRIDLHSYSWDSRLLVVQIDAAINPGNSGGPCVDGTGAVVGVAFQKGAEHTHDNIGYVIPALIVKKFLACCEKNQFGFGTGGFRFSLLDNPSLVSWMGLKSGETGVLIDQVEPTAPAAKLLHPGDDILIAVDGHEIGEDGTVDLCEEDQLVCPANDASDTCKHREGSGSGAVSKLSRSRLRVPVAWMFRRRSPGEIVSLKIMNSKREGRTVSLPLHSVRNLVPGDPLEGERLGRCPEYLMVAGIVFVPLTESFLTEEYGKEWEGCPIRLFELALHGRLEFAGQQMVVLSDVLAHEFTQGYEIHRRRRLTRCDGTEVRSLRHFASLLANAKGEFLKLEFAGDHMLVLRRDKIDEVTTEVAARNQISAHQHLVDRGFA